MHSNRAPFSIPRRPLLVLVLIIIVVFIFRAFLSTPSGGKGFGRTRPRTEISLLTYNIWLAPEMMRERMKALGQIVEELQPDIVAFQEVTLANLAVLQQQKWFSRYHLIPPDVSKHVSKEKLNHFVIILSVYPLDKWFIFPFKNSLRKRRLVVAETQNAVSTNVTFVIAGTHLAYNPEGTRLRELQLQESLKVLSSYENVCVMGDLNIEDKVDGDVVLPSSWIDAWLSLPGNIDSDGFTWDRNKSPFASVLKRTVNATSYQARLDRVLCRLSDFKVKEMKVVGNKLTKSGILPSDHFGVFTVIGLSTNTGRKHDKNSQTEQEVYFNRPPGWKKLIK